MTAEKPYNRDWAWAWPSSTGETVDEAAWSLVEESRFRPRIVWRARKRLEHQTPVNDWRKSDAWVLPGIASLGDQYPEYIVTLHDHHYICTCWSHVGGGTRRRHICSHAVAIMLWRRVQGHPIADAPEESQVDSDARQIDQDETCYRPPAERVGSWLNPHNLGLPFDSFRGVQILAMQRLLARDEKVLFLNAPTGSGKSLIAAAFAKVLNQPAVYMSTTKQLQDQFLAAMNKDTEIARALKGRANYTPLNFLPAEDLCDDPNAHDPDAKSESCEACDKEKVGDAYVCGLCHNWLKCPYEEAKRRAIYAPFAVLNTAYYLNEANFAGRFSDYGATNQKPAHPAGLRLVIIDEGDEIESALMNFISIEVSRQDLTLLLLDRPTRFDPKNKDEAWRPWIVDVALPAVKNRVAVDYADLADLKDVLYEPASEIPEFDGDEIKWRPLALKPDDAVEFDGKPVQVRVLRHQYSALLKRVRHWERLQDKFETLASDLRENANSWVRTDHEDSDPLTFKPVHVGRYANQYLWRHGTRFLVMSATPISADLLCNDLGLRREDVAMISIPSTFPKENRPIRFRPCGSMSKNNQTDTLPRVTAEALRIATNHPDERILVHSVSYALTSALCEALEPTGRVVTFGRGGRESAIAQYIASPGAILVGPALDRGIDLADDLCRVIIIPKVPKANIGDRQVAHRLYGFGRDGKLWYLCQTIRSLCQSTGRGVRHARDRCETWILDSDFEGVWREGRRMRLIPEWWAEAVVFDQEQQNQGQRRGA